MKTLSSLLFKRLGTSYKSLLVACAVVLALVGIQDHARAQTCDGSTVSDRWWTFYYLEKPYPYPSQDDASLAGFNYLLAWDDISDTPDLFLVNDQLLIVGNTATEDTAIGHNLGPVFFDIETEQDGLSGEIMDFSIKYASDYFTFELKDSFGNVSKLLWGEVCLEENCKDMAGLPLPLPEEVDFDGLQIDVRAEKSGSSVEVIGLKLTQESGCTIDIYNDVVVNPSTRGTFPFTRGRLFKWVFHRDLAYFDWTLNGKVKISRDPDINLEDRNATRFAVELVNHTRLR